MALEAPLGGMRPRAPPHRTERSGRGKASAASIDLTIKEILTDFAPKGRKKSYIPGMETHAIALMALAFACILHLELRSLKKRHEQLRRDFDEFINEILQKSSTESEKKEL